MVTRLLLVILILCLPACASKFINYQPTKIDSDPRGTVERLIKTQAPVYNPIPHKVTFGDDCFNIWAVRERKTMLFFKESVDTPVSICYRNLGSVEMYSWRYWWHVEIYDRGGIWLYGVYFYEEADARALVDALHTLKRS